MANKYQLWCEDANATMDYNTYVNDSQRQDGFQGGTPASATRVNTALRQANLVACALMNVVAPNDQTTDFRSSVNSVQTLIQNGLANIKVNNASNADNVIYKGKGSAYKTTTVYSISDLDTFLQSNEAKFISMIAIPLNYNAYTGNVLSITTTGITTETSNVYLSGDYVFYSCKGSITNNRADNFMSIIDTPFASIGEANGLMHINSVSPTAITMTVTSIGVKAQNTLFIAEANVQITNDDLYIDEGEGRGIIIYTYNFQSNN